MWHALDIYVDNLLEDFNTLIVHNITHPRAVDSIINQNIDFSEFLFDWLKSLSFWNERLSILLNMILPCSYKF